MTDNNKNTKTYFANFGLKQICDMTLIAASIVLIVGMFVEPIAVAIVGFALFILGSATSVVRVTLVLTRKISRSSPEFKNALVNLIIMAIVLALSIFGLVYYSVYMI